MKMLADLALIAVIAPAVHAHSRGSDRAATLGSYRQSGKPTVASVQQLERAKKPAEQAKARTGAGVRRSGWAYGSAR